MIYSILNPDSRSITVKKKSFINSLHEENFFCCRGLTSWISKCTLCLLRNQNNGKDSTFVICLYCFFVFFNCIFFKGNPIFCSSHISRVSSFLRTFIAPLVASLKCPFEVFLKVSSGKMYREQIRKT